MFRDKSKQLPTLADDSEEGVRPIPRDDDTRMMTTDPSDRPGDRPGDRPSDRPSDRPGEGAEGVPTQRPAPATPEQAVTDETPEETSAQRAPDDTDGRPSFLGDRLEGQPDDELFAKRSSWYVLRKAFREFRDDNGTDLAAALTYYAVLSIFPAALALLSTLGLFGQSQRALNAVLDVLRPLVSAHTLNNIQGPLENLTHSQAAGATFAIGIIGALWSASGYVGAFGRAMNRIYEVDEGRPFYRLRPMNIVVTVVTLVLSAASMMILAASGPVARSLGDELNLGAQAVTVWNYAKWPVLIIIVIANIAILYHFTPNVKLPKFRVLSVGAVVALLVWVVASALFALYVMNFSTYDRTYGSVAGVVVGLLWLWLTNLALIFGGELDSEIERARELHRGIAAEENIQLPVRSRRGIDRAEKRREKDWTKGRDIREQRVGLGDPQDRPF